MLSSSFPDPPRGHRLQDNSFHGYSREQDQDPVRWSLTGLLMEQRETKYDEQNMIVFLKCSSRTFSVQEKIKHQIFVLLPLRQFSIKAQHMPSFRKKSL